MLVKLMKHEWIAVRGFLFFICIAMIVSTIISGATFYTPLWNSNNEVSSLIAGLLLALNIITLAVASFATYIYFALRFYKNLFEDEGYLMHTLPVKSWQLILSKLIIAFILQTITFITLLLSVFGLIYASVLRFYSFKELQYHFQTYFTPMFQSIIKTLNVQLPLWIILCIIYYIVSTIFSILIIYASISIGQTFAKSKILFSVVTYFAINIVIQFITTFSLSVLNLSNELRITTSNMSSSFIDDFSFLTNNIMFSLILSITLTIIFSIIFFITSNYFMANKLNIE